MTRFFCAVFVAMMVASAAHADNRCPAWTQVDRPSIVETYESYLIRENRFVGLGARLDSETLDVIGGRKFSNPLGFRNPWPSLAIQNEILVDASFEMNAHLAGLTPRNYQIIEKLSDANSPNFAFWMPDLRAVERNLGNTPLLRPCEFGRPQPTTSEYVVRFRIIWPFVSGSEVVEASRRFRQAQTTLAAVGSLPQQHITRWEHSLNGPISGTTDFNIYDDDGDLAVMLHCSELWGENPAPNPLCSGHVWQRSKNIIIEIRFPSDQGQRGMNKLWETPVVAALELAEEWHIEIK